MELTQTLERRPVFPMIMSFARLEIGALGRRAAQAFGFQRPRHVDIDDPVRAAELIMLASSLMRIVDERNESD